MPVPAIANKEISSHLTGRSRPPEPFKLIVRPHDVIHRVPDAEQHKLTAVLSVLNTRVKWKPLRGHKFVFIA